jgi:rubrerythrin
MDEAVKRMTDGLAKAIKAEHDGHFFYLSAASNTQDPKGKEVFKMLAEEEQRHMWYLKTQHKSLVETGTMDTTIDLGSKMDLSDASPIFSEELKTRIKDANYEMSALSIGITLEQNAIRFYENEATIASDPGVKEFYLKLADWEKGHLDALMRQEDALKEDYWYQSGFYPY